MKIIDNGRGLSKDLLHTRGGIGITNMRERAELIKGELTIETNNGLGFVITLLVRQIDFDTINQLD